MLEEIRERIINIFTNRLTLLRLFFILLGGIILYRCFELQIVNGQTYLDNFVLEQEKTKDLPATRGNIYDRDGNLLAYNELAYSVKIEDVLDSGKNKSARLNALLFHLIEVIEKNGDSVDLDFKIYVDEDNEFAYKAEGSSLTRFLADVYDHTSTLDLTEEEASSTPLEVMEYLSRASGKGYHFAIGAYENPEDTKSTFYPGDGYTREDWLKLVCLRFNMSQTAYRKYLGTTVATAVSKETVAAVLENADTLPGVSIEEGTVRRYVDSMYFSHILGYTGKASSDEIANLNQSIYEATGFQGNYTSSDVVGKSGIEAYMETVLQGQKGHEKVMVDNTGKVISVLESEAAISGNDVYLSIDSSFTKAAYTIVEQKLAGLVASKILNLKEYNAQSSADIKIPIYDVYFSTINNNIINIKHFEKDDAQATEKKVFDIYCDYKAGVYDRLRAEMTYDRKPYQNLSKEYQNYESNVITLLTKNGVIMTEKVDTTDEVYIDWTIEEKISIGEYLEYCVLMNWIDVTKLDISDKYSDSTEIYHALVEKTIELADGNTEFQKKIYKYMLLSDHITGTDICMLLYEQDAIHIPTDEVEKLKKGSITAYQFMMNRIRNIDITPAQLALDPCNASVVITDVHTGQVLAMVSYPGYDNNKMANSVDAAYYDKLINDKSSPLLNYATQFKAAPGSTYKIVSAIAGLSEGVIKLDSNINCVCTFDAITPSPRCWNRYGHNNENVVTAIRDSCNYYFYEVGYRLGSTLGSYDSDTGLEALRTYADQFGLTDKSGVEISEYAPEVSDSDAVRSAIGQGTNSYTVASLARYATAIANSGTVYDLTLLDHVSSPDGTVLKEYSANVRNTVDIPQSYWNAVHEGMREVVEKKTYFADLSVEVAGKTGTAEQTKSRPNHALFICYAPYDHPEIAMATRIPFGYSSDYAAQVARDIIKFHYGLAEEEELLNGTADTPDAGVTNEM